MEKSIAKKRRRRRKTGRSRRSYKIMDNLIVYAGKQKKRMRKLKTKSRSSARIKNRCDTGTKDPNAPPDPNDMELTLEQSIPEDPSTPKRGTRNSTDLPAKKVARQVVMQTNLMPKATTGRKSLTHLLLIGVC